MKRIVLDAVLAARVKKHPLALATNLKSGEQLAISHEGEIGDLDLAPDAVEAAWAVVRHDRTRTVETPSGPVFIQPFNPPLRLFIVGAVHIAQALAPMASVAGYDVTVIDPRGSFASEDRFPGMTISTDWPDEALDAAGLDLRSAVITLTHDPKLDDPALASALRSEAFYIGALGSRKTHAARLERLRAQDFGDADLDRIHGPLGLALGGRSPSEIAIAALAQATQVLHRSSDDARSAA